MEIIFKAIAVAICGVICALLVKRQHPLWCIYISTATGIILLIMCAPYISRITELIEALSNNIGDRKEYILLLVRITGIAIIGEWSLQLCKDAGENSVALKLEVAIKVIMLCMTIPVLIEIIRLICNVLSEAGYAQV